MQKKKKKKNVYNLQTQGGKKAAVKIFILYLWHGGLKCACGCEKVSNTSQLPGLQELMYIHILNNAEPHYRGGTLYYKNRCLAKASGSRVP